MPANKRERPNKNDLMQFAKQLGFESAGDVHKVLKNNGVEGKFDPAKYGEYVAILTTHARMLDSILNSLNKEALPHDKNLGPRGQSNNFRTPAQVTDILRKWGQHPWLFRPVARDDKGNYRKLDSRDDLRKGEQIVYEGVTKSEHLSAVEEARRKENAVDSRELGSPGARDR